MHNNLKSETEKLNSYVINKFDEILGFEKLPKEFVDYIKEVVLFRNQLTLETERGSALYATSYLESIFDKLLRKKLIGSKKHLDELLSFNGALGNFSNKINISYSIGIIDKNSFDDLHLIRKIRNEFGHSPKVLTFEDEKIVKLCNRLKLIARNNVKTPRQKFNTSISYILGKLDVEIISTQKFTEREDVKDLEKIKKAVDDFLKLI